MLASRPGGSVNGTVQGCAWLRDHLPTSSGLNGPFIVEPSPIVLVPITNGCVADTSGASRYRWTPTIVSPGSVGAVTLTVSCPALVLGSTKPVTLIAVTLPGAAGAPLPAMTPPTCEIAIVFAIG